MHDFMHIIKICIISHIVSNYVPILPYLHYANKLFIKILQRKKHAPLLYIKYTQFTYYPSCFSGGKIVLSIQMNLEVLYAFNTY